MTATRHPGSLLRELGLGNAQFLVLVTGTVFESQRSISFGQAENRLHTTKAVLVAALAR